MKTALLTLLVALFTALSAATTASAQTYIKAYPSGQRLFRYDGKFLLHYTNGPSLLDV